MKRTLAGLALGTAFLWWLQRWRKAWNSYNQAEIEMDRMMEARNRYEENEE
jgi:hypothetical protein